MRQNLILFLTLSALLLGAYLFEELGDENKKAEEQRKTNLFDMKKYGEVKSFTSPLAGIRLKEKGQSVTIKDNWPVDPERLQEFFQILTGVRAKRILSDEELKGVERKAMFPSEEIVLTFQFEKGEVSFRLGKKLDSDQSFYLEVIEGDKKTIVIAHDVGEMTTVYGREDSHRDATKYRRFLTLFYLKDAFFHYKHILSPVEREKMRTVREIELDNSRNRKFKLVFEGSRTLPAPIPGIEINEAQFDEFLESFLKLKAEEIVFQSDPGKLTDHKSKIRFLLDEDLQTELDIYGSYGNKTGYFLLKNAQIFKLSKESSKPFFENVQFFWNKVPSNAVYKSNAPGRGKLTFAQGESVDFELINGKKFSAVSKTKGRELDNKELFKLFEFLKKEADFVSQGDVDEDHGIFQTLLNLDLGGEKIRFVRKNRELIVSKDNKRLKYHYRNLGNPPFAYEMSRLLLQTKGSL